MQGGWRVGGRIKGGKEGTDVGSELGANGRELCLDEGDGGLLGGAGGLCQGRDGGRRGILADKDNSGIGFEAVGGDLAGGKRTVPGRAGQTYGEQSRPS